MDFLLYTSSIFGTWNVWWDNHNPWKMTAPFWHPWSSWFLRSTRDDHVTPVKPWFHEFQKSENMPFLENSPKLCPVYISLQFYTYILIYMIYIYRRSIILQSVCLNPAARCCLRQCLPQCFTGFTLRIFIQHNLNHGSLTLTTIHPRRNKHDSSCWWFRNPANQLIW